MSGADKVLLVVVVISALLVGLYGGSVYEQKRINEPPKPKVQCKEGFIENTGHGIVYGKRVCIPGYYLE